MSHKAPYYTGQKVLITTEPAPFRKRIDGVPTAIDPDLVTMTIKKPDGERIVRRWRNGGPEAELDHPAVGVFGFEILADMPGRWHTRIQGEGTCDAAAEGSFYVARSNV